MDKVERDIVAREIYDDLRHFHVPLMECRKALTMFKYDREKAIAYLTSGEWRRIGKI